MQSSQGMCRKDCAWRCEAGCGLTNDARGKVVFAYEASIRAEHVMRAAAKNFNIVLTYNFFVFRGLERMDRVSILRPGPGGTDLPRIEGWVTCVCFLRMQQAYYATTVT